MSVRKSGHILEVALLVLMFLYYLLDFHSFKKKTIFSQQGCKKCTVTNLWGCQPKVILASLCEDVLAVRNHRVLSPLVSSVSKPQGTGMTNGYLPLRQKLQTSEATVWWLWDSDPLRVKFTLLTGMAAKNSASGLTDETWF